MSILTATEFSTVEDKERFIKQFKAFVESDYHIHRFPKWFYTRLSMCFGHIAHYDQLGFYDTFFRNIDGKIDFIEHCQYGGVGDPAYTFADVERQIQLWLLEEGILPKLISHKAILEDSVERSEYERLKLKYGK